jgi:hypothetical protein
MSIFPHSRQLWTRDPVSTFPEQLIEPVSGLPLWAWIVDGRMKGHPCTFERPELKAQDTERSNYLPVTGDDPPFDPDREYFTETFAMKGDHVVRTRAIHPRT